VSGRECCAYLSRACRSVGLKRKQLGVVPLVTSRRAYILIESRAIKPDFV